MHCRTQCSMTSLVLLLHLIVGLLFCPTYRNNKVFVYLISDYCNTTVLEILIFLSVIYVHINCLWNLLDVNSLGKRVRCQVQMETALVSMYLVPFQCRFGNHQWVLKKEYTVLIVSAKFTYCSPASIFDVTLKQKNALETGCKGTRKHFVSLLDKILELGWMRFVDVHNLKIKC